MDMTWFVLIVVGVLLVLSALIVAVAICVCRRQDENAANQNTALQGESQRSHTDLRSIKPSSNLVFFLQCTTRPTRTGRRNICTTTASVSAGHWRGSTPNCRRRETGITLRDHPGTTALHTTTWRWPPKSVPFGAWQIPSIRSRSFAQLRRAQPDEHRRSRTSQCQRRRRCAEGRVVRLGPGGASTAEGPIDLSTIICTLLSKFMDICRALNEVSMIRRGVNNLKTDLLTSPLLKV